MTIARDSLVDKIRALMSKTVENGCTEQEALAALAKARALMDAHEITDSELQLTKEESAVLRREPKGSKDPHGIKRGLAVAVSKFTDCRCWRSADGLTFCGLPSDARFATWLLDSLTTFVRGELVNHLMTDISAGADRRVVCNSFAAGCTSRISARLVELIAGSAAVANSNGRALVVVKSQAVSAKLAELGIHLQKGRSSRVTMDHGAYAAGKAAGERASFGRPIAGANATLRLR
jgi:Protein of unknown function (DUF2786)